LITISLDVTVAAAVGVMLWIVRLIPIVQVMLLAKVHTNRPRQHILVFDAVPYRLTLRLSLVPQLSQEMEKLPDLYRAAATLVRLCLQVLQLNWRLTVSPGLLMARDSRNMTLWDFWRYVVGAVIFILAVSLVLILPLALRVDDV
jgi:hypothetical protein